MNLQLLRAAACLGLTMALGFAFGAQGAQRVTGTVTHVSDGDSLWLRPTQGGAPVRVRLAGLDAPEICQGHGADARAALATRLLRRRVAVDVQARDTYDRWLGRVRLQGEDVGGWLVENGHAWSYDFRGRPAPYGRQQAMARQARRGLWSAPAPTEPRRFRQQHGPCR